mmetsp:Transcript_42048/g.70149  ORF Transcript_42048/g.70149 Transcript_42048/m.70149 type:complete len:257 (-) Transcript_42048:116-886(-)|eukprot:CAMPEP_0198201732 /NCGR_PEP_ID=MMETSP1445-20131203/4719_1 /TAXON_ID=36898 /ORGANISM="Pyramimonas sp., Strain CCMP2087" /LENGTH=256 /DNA_ID=CAMNT_0043872299 /DNA_START=69 /DNA_END=839 /DNA_ORIENTATION=-
MKGKLTEKGKHVSDDDDVDDLVSPATKRKRLEAQPRECQRSSRDKGGTVSHQEAGAEEASEAARKNARVSDASEAACSPQTALNADVTIRAKVITLLGQSLQDQTPLFDGAYAVEAALFEHWGSETNKEYRSHARSLNFNLKTNEHLRCQVVNSEISGKRLCEMPQQALATTKVKQEREEQKATSLRRALVTDTHATQAIATDQYTCRACGGRECTYLTLGGARDIGKSETWGSKDKASATKFDCQTCGHEWMVLE